MKVHILLVFFVVVSACRGWVHLSVSGPLQAPKFELAQLTCVDRIVVYESKPGEPDYAWAASKIDGCVEVEAIIYGAAPLGFITHFARKDLMANTPYIASVSAVGKSGRVEFIYKEGKFRLREPSAE